MLLKLKYTCLLFLLSFTCLPQTISLGNFAHKSALQWIYLGFLGCLFSNVQSCCIEILTKFPISDLSKAGWHSNVRKHWEKFQFEIESLWKEKTRTCQAQINFHDQSTKIKFLVLKLRHFCIMHGSDVEMPIARIQSNCSNPIWRHQGRVR